MKLILKTLAIAGLFAVTLGSPVQAQSPPTVTMTTSGSSGNYTLDFSVMNNLGSTLDIYFFGVLVDSGRDITGSPVSFNPNTWSSWNNASYGGSATVYNNNWIDLSFNGLPAGNTLSGFDVHSTDAVAPTNVQWFAYAYGGYYSGTGNFNSQGNPGFEGNAGNGANVPEPGALAMIASLGLTGAAMLRRKRSN